MAVPRRPIGRTTAYRWLGRLGFFQSWEVYIDGHERPDVKEYRDKIFLPEMEAIDRLTTRYIEIGGKLEVSHPELFQVRSVTLFISMTSHASMPMTLKKACSYILLNRKYLGKEVKWR